MSLQYGFNSHGWDKDDIKWQAKFDALGKNEQDYYHNVLPWTLVMTDVGYVSKETIPVIVHRLSRIDGGAEFVPKSDGKRLGRIEFMEFLTLYIGFEANVNTLTDREWANKFLPQTHDKTASIKSDKQEETMRSRFEKEVFGVVR